MASEDKMNQITTPKQTHTAITLSLIAVIICLLVNLAILAAVPPVSRDALTHHLAVPKLYLAQGGMVEMGELLSYRPYRFPTTP